MKVKTIAILILISLTIGCISDGNKVINEIRHGVIQYTPYSPQLNDEPIASEPINVNETPIDSNIDSLRIGAFNVQVFGVTKASKSEVMNVLEDIIRTYDVIAIQEIRDSSQTSLPALVELVNSDGSQYNYVVSERLGRTTSKEQYAYIYNTQTVSITDAYTYPEPNGTDPFHRQPYIASIEALQGNFDATLMVIHTDPDEATEEINGLDEVLSYAQSQNPDEKDFIIMGDLNADGSYFDEDGTSDLDAYYWVIDDSQDTTTKSTDYTYDRIILTDNSDLTGDSGVFRYDLIYGLDEELTTGVSDHYPIYAEFLIGGDSD
jgi:endonuclease/exonuclease/phosphatase family metal-dependent hydrolase